MMFSHEDHSDFSLYDWFVYQEYCPYTRLSLLRGAAALRMQSLVLNCIVLTLRMSLHRVSLQGELTVHVSAWWPTHVRTTDAFTSALLGKRDINSKTHSTPGLFGLEIHLQSAKLMQYLCFAAESM